MPDLQTSDERSGSTEAPAPRRPVKPSRIVMICDVDLDEADATRTHTVQIAAGFAAEGSPVELITRGGDPGIHDVHHHRAKGTEHGRLRRIPDINVRASLLLAVHRRRAAWCYVRERWSNMPTLLVARLLRYRVVLQVDDFQYGRGHGVAISPVVDHVKRLSMRMMGQLAHHIVAVTPEIKELIVQQCGVPADHIVALRNGADVDFFKPQSRADAISACDLDPSLTYVLFCGNFQEWVNFDVILDAFALVSRRHPQTHLLLVGDGDQRPYVERRVNDLSIGRFVTITGFMHDRAEVRDLIAAATVALAAHRSDYVSRIGVSPVKIAEYMACARAVVAIDIPGLGEALDETGAGVIVPADAELYADAIERLLDAQRADAMGAIGRSVAEERYSWRSIAKRTLTLFT